jgi:hypothetical protein
MTAVPGSTEPPEPLQPYSSKTEWSLFWTPSVDELLPFVVSP